MSENTKKLAVLRTRTDRDLLVLVNRELDRGHVLANVATSRNSPLFAQAQKALRTATALLPRIAEMDPVERRRVDEELKVLRSRLDQIQAPASVRPYPASFAS